MGSGLYLGVANELAQVTVGLGGVVGKPVEDEELNGEAEVDIVVRATGNFSLQAQELFDQFSVFTQVVIHQGVIYLAHDFFFGIKMKVNVVAQELHGLLNAGTVLAGDHECNLVDVRQQLMMLVVDFIKSHQKFVAPFKCATHLARALVVTGLLKIQAALQINLCWLVLWRLYEAGLKQRNSPVNELEMVIGHAFLELRAACQLADSGGFQIIVENFIN